MERMLTMYEKLGDERLQKLIDAFYDRVFESEIIGPLFNQTDKEIIKDKQFCFITQFLGGPLRYFEKYGNPKMRMRHLPHPIGEKERDEWLKLMKEAIQTLDWDDENKEALYNCFPTLASHMMNKS
jgi:hemoglobin